MRKGDWMQTFTGKMFWPLDPIPSEIDIRDIAHALSLQCRFAGHCSEFYSVAEHSVRVSMICATRPMTGLLHDAAEAYVVDIPGPFKCQPIMRPYRDAEQRIEIAVFERFDCLPVDDEVEHADEILLATEARDLMQISKPWHLEAEPMEERIVPWSSIEAEVRFLRRFIELGGE